MSKINLTDLDSVANLQTLASRINANNAEIETKSDSFLSRDGTTPNQMETPLDMNSNRLYNLLKAVATTEPVRLKEFQEAVFGEAIAFPTENLFNTRTEVIASEIDAEDVQIIFVGGYSSVGDGGHGLYKTVPAEPTHPGKIEDAGGGWWELIGSGNILQFGADRTGVASSSTALENGLKYALEKRSELFCPAGTYLLSTAVSLHDYIDASDQDYPRAYGLAGEGPTSTRFLIPSSNTTGGISVTFGSLDSIWAATIRDFSIRIEGTLSGPALKISGTRKPSSPIRQVHLSNLRINTVTDGIPASTDRLVDVRDTLNPLIENCRFSGCELENFDERGDVNAATTSALPACTYDNHVNGEEATLTGDANGALAAIDGITLAAGDHVLVKDQSDGEENGVYDVTQLGDGGSPFILTRIPELDEGDEFPGATFFVTAGTLNIGTSWTCTNETVVVGTTEIVFEDSGGAKFWQQAAPFRTPRILDISRCSGANIDRCSFGRGNVLIANIAVKGEMQTNVVNTKLGACGTAIMIKRGSNRYTISSITKASPGVVTTTENHVIDSGDRVHIENITGMYELQDREFRAANVTANTFELQDALTGTPIDTSSYGTFTAGEVTKLADGQTFGNVFVEHNHMHARDCAMDFYGLTQSRVHHNDISVSADPLASPGTPNNGVGMGLWLKNADRLTIDNNGFDSDMPDTTGIDIYIDASDRALGVSLIDNSHGHPGVDRAAAIKVESGASDIRIINPILTRSGTYTKTFDLPAGGAASSIYLEYQEKGTDNQRRIIRGTGSGAAVDPRWVLYRDSSTPAAADIIGGVQFDGNDSGLVQTKYAAVEGRIDDTTNGQEDGGNDFRATIAGTDTKVAETGLWGIRDVPVSLTATATTGTAIPSYAGHVTVTSGGSARKLVLPSGVAGLVGKTITFYVGSNGFDLSTPAGSGEFINNADCSDDGSVQAPIPATSFARATLITPGAWILEGYSNTAAYTAIVPT